MKIYGGGKAPNPLRVSIFLAEKGVEIETEHVDIGELEHREQAFGQINDRQLLPVLELDDGTIIAETIAICRYLESLYPEPALFGENPLESAQVEMWQRRTEFELFMPIAHAFRHRHPAAKALEPVQIGSWGDLNVEFAIKGMERLNTQLSSNFYVSGAKFTVADITAFTAMQFRRPAKIDIPDGLDHLKEWYERIKERPSTQFYSS